jgi:hypothetical protein
MTEQSGTEKRDSFDFLVKISQGQLAVELLQHTINTKAELIAMRIFLIRGLAKLLGEAESDLEDKYLEFRNQRAKELMEEVRKNYGIASTPKHG